MYDILVFSNFRYLLQILQYILTYLDSIKNMSLAFFSYSLGENKFVYSNKLLPFNMKSINQIQQYPHIIESFSCII